MVMLSDEQKAFLLHGTRTGKLATVRKDGSPHVAPIWFVLDGDTLIFNTGEDTVKGASIRRDPRIALCVDDETPPWGASWRSSMVRAMECRANYWCGSR